MEILPTFSSFSSIQQWTIQMRSMRVKQQCGGLNKLKEQNSSFYTGEFHHNRIKSWKLYDISLKNAQI